MLLAIVKGAIGSSEWRHGRKFNVQRISGLDDNDDDDHEDDVYLE
jgi:hypothetical protein